MKIIDFSKSNSIINKYVGELIAYELSKTFDYEEREVQTPLGVAKVNVPTDKLVLGTIFRAGLPFHQGFLNIFDHAGNAFVSAYREYEDADHTKVGIHVEYLATPDLNDATLLIVDPMLATGGSMTAAIQFLREAGVKDIRALTLVSAPEGVHAVLDYDPDVRLYTCALDRELNKDAYILPGLGDAGDRIYGTK